MERTFEDAKGELGLSHFGIRTFTSLVRHLILTAVSLFLLARSLPAAGERPGPDDLPDPPVALASHPTGVGSRVELA